VTDYPVGGSGKPFKEIYSDKTIVVVCERDISDLVGVTVDVWINPADRDGYPDNLDGIRDELAEVLA